MGHAATVALDWRLNLIDDDDGLRAILRAARHVAVIGAKEEARSYAAAHYVPRYLREAGYRVSPVNPTIPSALGLPTLPSVLALPTPPDIVNVFRRSDNVLAHAQEILAGAWLPSAFWMQVGVRQPEAARLLAEAGVKVIQDRCILVEHRRLVGGR